MLRIASCMLLLYFQFDSIKLIWLITLVLLRDYNALPYLLLIHELFFHQMYSNAKKIELSLEDNCALCVSLLNN